MENTGNILATNIQTYRKKSKMTQEELANKLGVSFQAVSKWENAKSLPDILFLPVLAELFNCNIDELFSRKSEPNVNNEYCTELPWEDDGVIRGVVCKGRKILQKTDKITEKFTFEIIGDAKSVQSQCNIYVEGCVSGGCNANGEVNITGHLSGGCNSNGNVTVGGHFSGGCNAGGNITVGGDLSGDINCGETVQVNGNVKADKIKGNLVCNSIKCDKVEGNVVCNSIDSDIVKGDIKVKE